MEGRKSGIIGKFKFFLLFVIIFLVILLPSLIIMAIGELTVEFCVLWVTANTRKKFKKIFAIKSDIMLL